MCGLPARKAFLLTYLVFLRNDILGIQLPRMKLIVVTVLCQCFSEFHAIRNFLLHKFSSRPFHSECCHQVGLLLKKFFSYLQVSELVLQFFAPTARPCKFHRQRCRRLEDQQSVQNSTFGQMRLWWNWVGVPYLQLLLCCPRQAQSVGAPMNPLFPECYFWSFSRRELSGEPFSLSTFADNLHDASCSGLQWIW